MEALEQYGENVQGYYQAEETGIWDLDTDGIETTLSYVQPFYTKTASTRIAVFFMPKSKVIEIAQICDKQQKVLPSKFLTPKPDKSPILAQLVLITNHLRKANNTNL